MISIIDANINHGQDICSIESTLFGFEAMDLNSINHELSIKSRLYKLAVLNETNVVGYLGVNITDDFSEIIKIGVLSECSNMGIGTKLLDSMVLDLKKKGVGKILLEVRSDNIIAKNFYLKFGFKFLSVRKKYYADLSDAEIMEKNI